MRRWSLNSNLQFLVLMSHLPLQMNPMLMIIMMMVNVMIEPFLLFNNKEMIIVLLGTELEDKSESQPDTLMII